ncbi:MAG: hypothetical protein U0169_16495 [Polyangiaceae bacterium]
MTSDDRVLREIEDLFRDLDQLLKNPEAGAVLSDRGINVSLAMTAAEGLRAYLAGDKARAAEDLATAAEEIAARLRGSATPMASAKDRLS